MHKIDKMGEKSEKKTMENSKNLRRRGAGFTEYGNRTANPLDPHDGGRKMQMKRKKIAKIK